MYIYAPTLDAVKPTVFMVYLLAGSSHRNRLLFKILTSCTCYE
jgi:hypothetical protein